MGDGAWPGRGEAATKPFGDKATTVQNAIALDVNAHMGGSFDERRFIPFVMMHEFEGLLFSDCHSFSNAIGQPKLADKFQNIRDQFGSPEEISDRLIRPLRSEC